MTRARLLYLALLVAGAIVGDVSTGSRLGALAGIIAMAIVLNLASLARRAVRAVKSPRPPH